MNEAIESIMRLFDRFALELVQMMPRNAERRTALRKLLEAKDAAVAAIIKGEKRK